MATTIPTKSAAGALALLAFAQTIVGLDFGIVFTALPSIGTALNFTPEGLQWVVSAYTLTIGGFILLGSRATDLLGRRRVFIVGLTLFAVASLVGGLSHSGGLLIAARAVQGLGGALLFPSTVSLVNTTFAQGPARNKALAVWSSAGAAGGALGVVLGGILTTTLGWEWVFFINVPLAGVAAVLAPLFLRKDDAMTEPLGRLLRRFDIWGAATVTLAALALVLGLIEGLGNGWQWPVGPVAVIAAAVFAGLFVVIERRVASPMVPFILLRNRNLVIAVLVAFVFMAVFGSQFYLLNIWMQHVRGYSALQAGFGILPLSVFIVVGARTGGRIVTRFGARGSLVIGLIVGAAGLLFLALSLSVDGGYASELLPGIIVSGIGQGITFTSLWIVASKDAPPAYAGVVSGITSTAQQIGAPVGLAILVGIANSGQAGLAAAAATQRLNDGLQLALGVSTALAVLVAIVAVSVLKKPVREPIEVMERTNASQ